jgi:methionyl aminopeptidase
MSENITQQELKIMRQAGVVASAVLKKMKRRISPGISTKDIENFFDEYILKYSGMDAAFKGFKGYPASICVSVNEEIIHGIPSSRIVHEGDIVSVDLGIKYQGLFVDTAYTYVAGRTHALAKKLLKVTRNSLFEGIKRAKVGARIGDIGSAIQRFVEKNGFSIIRKFVGHGIGRGLHLLPEVPNFGEEGMGVELEEGMVIAIEPMVAAGNYEADILDDGWTAKTRDNSLSAHFEHTVAITKHGPKILTL